MPADTLTVLLVPDAQDTHGLLRDGPAGARVPQALLAEETDDQLGGWMVGAEYIEIESEDGDVRRLPLDAVRPEFRALVLAFDGVLVPEGYDRFVRVVNHNSDRRGLTLRPRLDHLVTDTAESIAETARREAPRLAARVVLLRDGREVTE